MITPVFVREVRRAGRSHVVLVLRWVIGGLLFLSLPSDPISQLANVLFLRRDPAILSVNVVRDADFWLRWMSFTSFFLTILLAPVFAASAVTEEKNSGSLQLLLASGLTPWDILLGKLLGRLWPVLLLLFALLPVLCWWGGLAGRSAAELFALLALPLGPLVALGAAGLLASVWARTTTQALVGVYGMEIVGGGLVVLVGGIFRCLDPFFVLAPTLSGADTITIARRLGLALLAWSGLALLCLGLAVWRLRPAYLRQLAGPSGGKTAPARPPVSDDPLLWKELYAHRGAPAIGLPSVPWWLALAGIILLSSLLLVAILWLDLGSLPRVPRAFNPFGKGAREWAAFFHGLVIALLSLVLIGVRSSGAIRSERNRGTWDALLVTDLSPRELLQGKARGIFWASARYVLAALVPGLVLTLPLSLGEETPVPFWPIFWALLTLPALSLMGATGLSASSLKRGNFDIFLDTFVRGFALIGLVSLGASVLVCPLVFGWVPAPGLSAAEEEIVTCFCYGAVAFTALVSLVFFRRLAGYILKEAEPYLQ